MRGIKRRDGVCVLMVSFLNSFERSHGIKVILEPLYICKVRWEIPGTINSTDRRIGRID
jgi:hypothetical protein